jgi:hypothetical protein
MASRDCDTKLSSTSHTPLCSRRADQVTDSSRTPVVPASRRSTASPSRSAAGPDRVLLTKVLRTCSRTRSRSDRTGPA